MEAWIHSFLPSFLELFHSYSSIFHSIAHSSVHDATSCSWMLRCIHKSRSVRHRVLVSFLLCHCCLLFALTRGCHLEQGRGDAVPHRPPTRKKRASGQQGSTRGANRPFKFSLTSQKNVQRHPFRDETRLASGILAVSFPVSLPLFLPLPRRLRSIFLNGRYLRSPQR